LWARYRSLAYAWEAQRVPDSAKDFACMGGELAILRYWRRMLGYRLSRGGAYWVFRLRFGVVGAGVVAVEGPR